MSDRRPMSSTWPGTRCSRVVSRFSGSARGSACCGSAAATRPRAAGSCAEQRTAGVLAIVALEAGWIVTEVGRQPWIVWGRLRTADAVTAAGGVERVARRGHRSSTSPSGIATDRRPPGAEPALERPRRSTASDLPYGSTGQMTLADVDRRSCSGSGTMIYAVFGGADFGAGLWDLLAGATTGAAPPSAS